MIPLFNLLSELFKKWEPLLYYVLAPAALLVVLRWNFYLQHLRGSEAREEVWDRLEKHGGRRDDYFRRLRSTLNWVDSKLGARSLLNGGSYDFALRMAFVYPFVSLFLIWVVTGQNTSGISGWLPEDLKPWQRAAAIGGMGVSGIFFYKFSQASGLRQWVYFAFAAAAAAAIASAFVGAFAVAYALAAAFTVAIAAFASAVAVAFAVTFGASFSAESGSAIAGAIVGAIMGVQVTMYRRGRQYLFYLLFIPLLLLLLFVAVAFASSLIFKDATDEQIYKSLLIFLILLPIINSIFDWLSLAATRWLLRNIVDEQYSAPRIVANALFDLAIAIVLLAALAVSCTAALQVMNLLSQSNGGPLYCDVADLLHRIRTSPGDPAVWWVYFTLFSTLAPTLVHATVAAGSFVTWHLPERWRDAWQEILLNHNLNENFGRLVGMAWRLTALDAAAVVLGLAALAVPLVLLLFLLPQLGWILLAVCELVAQALHAPVMLGPFFHA